MDPSQLKRKSFLERQGEKRARTRSRTWSEKIDEDTIAVGSRKSRLAVIQTETIMRMLKEKVPDLKLKMLTMETLGDKILNIALPKIGEKSLFTKDLEIALAGKKVQFLVHSLKDLPTTLPDDMAIGTIIKRDNPFDCVMFHPKHKGKQLADLPGKSVIGTSSVRRIAQLKRHYGQLEFKSVRGNLNTRLKKLEEENLYDALILAKAGIDRMGWQDKVDQIFTEDNCLYAIGQGAIAVEIRRDDEYMKNLLGKLTDLETLLCCACERTFMRKLDGGCSTPVACICKIENGKLSIHGRVLSTEGDICLDHTVECDININIPTTCEESSSNAAQCSTSSSSSNSKGTTKSYSVSESGVVVETKYLNELNVAEDLGHKLALAMIEQGADKVLADVRANIPKVMNIQIPTNV